ncbi:MAG: T9SS type A sorting domain-containing protein [Bacteroidales bacterium]|nr:T9SS type A sorting domain-containing protein [Bacteroidales bacterium]
MKKFCFILLMMFIPFIIIAQTNVSITNQKTIGGANSDYLGDAIRTKDDGFLLAAISHSDMTFDKTDSLIGFTDWWIMKLDNNLNIEWQETIGSVKTDGIVAILENEQGYILAGYTSDSLKSGDKTVANYGSEDNWIMQIDTQGNIIWQKVFGGLGSEIISDAIRVDNRIFVLSSSDSDSSGTKSENCRGIQDGWIYCLDDSGNLLWDKTVGGNDWDNFNTIKQKDKYLYLIGASSSDISGEKSEASYGGGDMWIVKMDTTGQIVWDKTIGGQLMDEGRDVLLLNDTIAILGFSYSQATGNKTSLNFGQKDIWLKYMNDNHQFLQDTVFGGTENDVGRDFILNERKNLIIAGNSASPVSGNKTVPAWSVPGSDYWLKEVSKDGSIIWQKVLGGFNWDFPSKILQIAPNNYMVFGYSLSGSTGNKTGFNRGKEDVWIVELSTDVGVEEKNSAGFSLFPNPTNGKVNIKLGKTHKNIRLRLLTTTGQLIEQRQYENRQEIRYERNDLSPGLYLLELKTADQSAVTKKLLVK